MSLSRVSHKPQLPKHSLAVHPLPDAAISFVTRQTYSAYPLLSVLQHLD